MITKILEKIRRFFFAVKCPFWKICKHYDKDSWVCNEVGGMYYGPGRPAGCYVQMMEKIKKRK